MCECACRAPDLLKVPNVTVLGYDGVSLESMPNPLLSFVSNLICFDELPSTVCLHVYMHA